MPRKRKVLGITIAALSLAACRNGQTPAVHEPTVTASEHVVRGSDPVVADNVCAALEQVKPAAVWYLGSSNLWRLGCEPYRLPGQRGNEVWSYGNKQLSVSVNENIGVDTFDRIWSTAQNRGQMAVAEYEGRRYVTLPLGTGLVIDMGDTRLQVFVVQEGEGGDRLRQFAQRAGGKIYH